MNFSENDIKNLKKMFIDVFSEDSNFVDMMFEHKFTPDNTFIIKENTSIVSMAYCVIFKCKVNKIYGKCVYVYGVATDEKHRGKGYMSKILSDIYNYYKENREILFLYLVPAEKSLFSMYERLGYKTNFYLNKRELDISERDYPTLEIKRGKLHEDYISYINQFDNVVIRSDTDNDLALRECIYEKAGESGFLYYIDGDVAHIRESYIYNENDFYGFLGHLKRKGVKKVIHTEKALNNINDYPYAMVRALAPVDFFGTSYTNVNFD